MEVPMVIIQNPLNLEVKFKPWKFGEFESKEKYIDKIKKRVGEILGLNHTSPIFITIVNQLSNKDHNKAFFNKLDHTIYIEKKHFNEDVLAHEIAHSLIHDNYPNMSRECHEVLAKYAMKNLYK